MKIEIKCRFSESVLFEHEADENSLRLTLEAGVKARANLARANLAGANLAGANLVGANLDGANLVGANLVGAYLARAYLARANLAGANLDGANLVGANLVGAYLARANLDGANLAGANLAGAYLVGAYLDGKEILTGERPILQIGPIGSRCAYLIAYLTNCGIRIRAGCFFGSRDEFVAKLAETHGDNAHAKEYRAALHVIDTHAELWSPKSDTEAE